MVSVNPGISAIGGRRIVIALGVIYITAAAGWAIIRTTNGEPILNVLIVSLLIIGPGVILLSGGHQLPRTDIDPEFYPVIAGWCLGGIGLMFGILTLYHLQPADSLNNPDRSILILSALSSVAGFGVGTRDARAKTRALELNQRNQELQELRAQLEESNERLEQFAYAASHDLQEPLRMITSYLNLLDRRYTDDLDEDAEEFIEFAVDGAERMKEMIDALLEYSRIETQGEPFEQVDLEEIVRDVQKNLEVQISETGATIDVDSLPEVIADERQLRQVFQNTVSNAIEYSEDEPPQVHISADRDGMKWIVSVRDEGIGIPRKNQADIFDVFQRLHTQEEHAGTGIGLAICQRIIERHGGDIWVESEPGEGATFFFTLQSK